MNKKISVTIFIILLYSAFFSLLIYSTVNSYECYYDSPCIRFCSEDLNHISNKDLIEQFNQSKTVERLYNGRDYLKIIRGPPICGNMKPSTNSQYEFNYNGEVFVGHERYSFYRYCLQEPEMIHDDWILMTCYQDYYLQKGFHIFAITISICLLGFTIFVYASFKELRDIYGKTVIAIIISQISTYLLVPFIRLSAFHRHEHHALHYLFVAFYSLSASITLLWITVFIAHSYLTFRNFKDKKLIPYEFSTYTIFVITFSLFSAFIFVEDSLFYGENLRYLIFLYIFMGFVDIILLVITGIKIFRTSRHLEHSEQARFDTEKKWFWMIIKISLLMLITWPFETTVWYGSFSFMYETVADSVELLTAITITMMLVGREKARILLFGKYRKVRDLESDVK